MDNLEATGGTDRTVYVKTIAVTDLPREVRDQAEGLEQLYAVHDAQGQDRKSTRLNSSH